MYLSKSKSQKAFTLIELLVVMAIIAILSAIMFSPIQTARRRSKDTQAVADMKLIANDLELYYQDNGYYPSSPGAVYTAIQIYGNVPVKFNNTATAVNNKYNYVFLYNNIANTTGFHLWTKLNDMNEAFNSDADCNSSNVSNANSSCWSSMTSVYGAYDPTATTSESNLNATSCGTTGYCILDYANGK